MRKMSKIQTNMRVVAEQWEDYVEEVKYVIIPGIKNASWKDKPHKMFAFIEEFFDKNPRIVSYVFFVSVVAGVGYGVSLVV